MEEQNKQDNKEIQLCKQLLADFPSEFHGPSLYDAVLKETIASAKQELGGRLKKVFQGVYYEEKEIAQKEAELAKLKASLAKKKEQIEVVKKGDFSVLFAKQ